MKQKKQECMMPRRDEKSRPIPKKDDPPMIHNERLRKQFDRMFSLKLAFLM